MDVALGSQHLIASRCGIAGVLVQLYIVIIPFTVLVNTDPAVGGQWYGSAGSLTTVDLDLQIGGFPDQHTQECSIAVAKSKSVKILTYFENKMPEPSWRFRKVQKSKINYCT